MGRLFRYRHRFRLRTRFALMAGAIVCAFCAGSAFLFYAFLKEKVIQDTYEKGQIVFALMDGVGAYVSNTLRPRMFSLIHGMPKDQSFVAEAMSTTRIRHGVMGYVIDRKPEFLYRRVSLAPRNPENFADPFHAGMIGRFRAETRETQWHGISKEGDAQFFYIMKPVYVKGECLKCHGSPGDAPPGLVKLYGAERGFGYREGDLMGLESVSISLSPALAEINQTAVHVTSIGICAMLVLFIAIEGTFLQFVGKPLRALAARFEDIAGGTHLLRQEIPVQTMDEIGELTTSFNIMAGHLAEAQETLESNAAVLQSIIDGISDPLALVGADGSLSVLNQAYQAWLARSSPAVLGQHRDDVPDGDGRSPQGLLKAAFASANPVNGEWTGPDGRCYFMHFYPIPDEKGQVGQIVHYVSDITVRRQVENQMIQMEKLAAIGRLAAGVAHEINNPLGIILCYTRLIERDLDSDHPSQEDVRVIERNATACKRIVDGLLSFSRCGETRKQEGQLNRSLSEIVALVERQFNKEGITLVTDLDPDLPPFTFDPERLKQVYMNLLMNAGQAMPHGGRISIRTRYLPERSLVEVRIQDTGAGIKPEHMDEIFNPFFTTKQTGEGTGLGLSVSYGIVKEHGGEILVENVPGGGAAFTVALPLEYSDAKRA